MKVGDPPSVSEHENVSLLLKAGRLGSLQHLPLIENLESEDLVCKPNVQHVIALYSWGQTCVS